MIDKFHSAYTPADSTCAALNKVLTDTTSRVENDNLRFLDSAACDTTDHSKLLGRLQDMALKWFHSYLQESHQCVQIRESMSINRSLMRCPSRLHHQAYSIYNVYQTTWSSESVSLTIMTKMPIKQKDTLENWI